MIPFLPSRVFPFKAPLNLSPDHENNPALSFSLLVLAVTREMYNWVRERCAHARDGKRRTSISRDFRVFLLLCGERDGIKGPKDLRN